MIDQKKTKTESGSHPEPKMRNHLGDLGADLLTLGELQLELFTVDGKEAAKQSLIPGFMIVAAIGFLMGACPLLLLGLSWWIADVTQLSQPLAAVVVAAGGFVMAAILFFMSWVRLKRSFAVLKRSRAELEENLKWVKKLLSRNR